MQRLLLRRLLPALILLATACSSAVDAPSQVAHSDAPDIAAPPTDPATEVGQPSTPVPAPTPEGHVSRSQSRQRPADPSVSPRVARGPQSLARQILTVERIIRDDEASDAEVAVAGHTQQIAYRRLSEKPSWDGPVLQQLPRGLRPSVRANLRAYRELASLSSSKPPKTLPAWRIVEPAPPEQLLRHYRKAERRFGVPWEYLAAINLVETRMGRIDGVSTAGAQGPMQFIPPTWAIYGKGDVRRDHDAIMAAGRYLKARGAPGDMGRALYSYNNSTKYVRAVAAHAEVMRRDPRAFRGYYHWQVYYRQPGGPVWLPVGYDGT